ncbi:MAG: L-aspartate oxidase [Pseudonocardiaceae bacterium]|nr:L-aspartate oxidase [Pseudonocardiaceae bacterium]
MTTEDLLAGSSSRAEDLLAGSSSRADLVVVGTGVAGLSAALRARELGLRVVVVTKAGLGDGSTRWAQGGVAVALPGTADSVAAHVADTVAAGAGLCDEAVVRELVGGGPAAVAALRQRGAVFDAGPDGAPARTREGGHTAFRVIHAGGDATGAEVLRALAAAAVAGGLPVLERVVATEVLCDDAGAVAGLAVLGADGEPAVLPARAVLLATGGLGQLYAATTNPDVATGDGLALALRAGAAAADLEFVQFHPTVLHGGPGARGRRPLVTEAVRGEGAVLVDVAGVPVTAGVHPLGDLAPRDVVAAAITRRMAATGTDHVLLDATGLAGFAARFPTVWAACAAAGIDPATDPVPVTPAAHYHCGGVVTDSSGRSTVPGLYAAGEVARTGLHGANRLASNSLLEGLVVGAAAATAVARDLAGASPPGTARVIGAPQPMADRDALQQVMSTHAGIGRHARGLDAAAALLLAAPQRQVRSVADAEDAALTTVAAALLCAASARTETRGCHVRTDHPHHRQRWRRSITVRLDVAGRPVLDEHAAAGAA